MKTNLCCELARLGGGIGVDRFVIVPLEENADFLLRGIGATLSCDKENVLWRFSSLTIAKLLWLTKKKNRKRNRMEKQQIINGQDKMNDIFVLFCFEIKFRWDYELTAPTE